ncbi:MAG: glutathione S-transferase family protein [Pseudomonadota bacterium]
MTKSNERFELMGLDASPYTMKVQSFLKFKGIPYDWTNRNLKTEKRFQQHANVQLIPLLFFPNGETMQDSTPIIERLDKEYPSPEIHPTDPALWYLSCLLEEFGDEWCNKLMFFQRWFYEADQKATGRRLAGLMLEGQWYKPFAKPIVTQSIIKRMIPRLSFAGANETNIPHLKESFENFSGLFDAHLESRPYLFGARPCFGDFGMWCNLYQAWTDPTAKAYFERHTPHVLAYIKRMLDPKVEGDFESLEDLAPTLEPIMQQEVGPRFLPWMVANEKAWEAGDKETSLTMKGQPFRQNTFKYQAATLKELRSKYNKVKDNDILNTFLSKTGCLDAISTT